MTIQFCNFSCTIAAAPRRAIAKPLLHSAAFHHRHVRLRHAFSLAICSYHTTTTTTTHYAASAHTHHHIHRHFLIHNHNPIRLHLPCLFQLLLRRTAQSLSLDDCATISATTTAHTPHPSFSIYSTSPFLHVATTTSHTTYRTYHRYADPVTSSTTTSNSSSSSTHRPAVDYAPGSLATLLSISPSYTTFTSTFASAAASTSHRRTTTSSTPTTGTIGPHSIGPKRHHISQGPYSTGPKRHHFSHWLPTIPITIHCISRTSHCTFTACNGQARQHRFTSTATTFPTPTSQQSPPPPQEPTQVGSSPPWPSPPPPQASTSPPLKASQHHPATPFALNLHLYSYSPTPSRSRSPQPIDLRPNTDNTNTDPSQYPTTAVLRRPLNRWRPPPFQALSPTDQLLEWFEFHANQLDAPNRPQHQYIANLLTDCNITYKEITDFRQYTHTKWNETTHQYDQFQYNAISLPYLNTKATTPEPPAVSRATSTHREVAHINAGHTGPVSNIANILHQGRFLPSALHFANYPGFFAQGVHHPQSTPRPKRVRSHHPQHLAAPQKHPLNHHHTPRLGCSHQIHFRWRRTSHDPR